MPNPATSKELALVIIKNSRFQRGLEGNLRSSTKVVPKNKTSLIHRDRMGSLKETFAAHVMDDKHQSTCRSTIALCGQKGW